MFEEIIKEYDQENYLYHICTRKVLVSYRDYYDILDELREIRKIYGKAGSIPFDIRDDFDTFYYGFPIRKGKVEKMHDEINKRIDKEFLFKIIDEARVLNNRIGLDTFMDNKLLEIVNEALDECPCAAMNGFTQKSITINFMKNWI